METPHTEALVGRQIGKYALRRELGTGASGVVYLAEDTSLGRKVALKVLHAQLARDAGFLHRFKHEARVIASLAHPHIVRVHAFDALDGLFIIDTEFLPGGPLSERCARSVFDANMIARVARDVLSALEFCHAHDILHRDIKPGNILLDAAGNAQVADFGIAKALGFHTAESLAGETSTGLFLGTPRYAPPEAWEGKLQTPQSDLYSIGVVLYEMATGHPPYEANTPLALMREMLTSPLIRLQPEEGQLSPEFTELINALVCWEPAKRPATAGAALERLLNSPEGHTLANLTTMTTTQPIARMDRGAQHDGELDSAAWRPTAPVARRLIIGAMLLAISAPALWLFCSRILLPAGRGDHAPEQGRRPLQDVIQREIPNVETLPLYWRDVHALTYTARRVSSGSAATSQWIIGARPDGTAQTALVVADTGIQFLNLDSTTGQIQGDWAALEDDANTVLRYGSLTGHFAGDDADGARTVSLEYMCVQDQTTTGETWHLSKAQELSDTAILLRAEENPKIPVLLSDELLPRGLDWAREAYRMLPAIPDQYMLVHQDLQLDTGSHDTPAQLYEAIGRGRASGATAPGIPLNLGASCVGIQNADTLNILYLVPEPPSHNRFVQIGLSSFSGILDGGQAPIVLTATQEDSKALPSFGPSNAPPTWRTVFSFHENSLIVHLTIPMDSVPEPLRRMRWRMNAQVGRLTAGGEFAPHVAFGSPDFSALEHGLVVQLDPELTNWN